MKIIRYGQKDRTIVCWKCIAVTQFENNYVEFSCLYKNDNFENERSNFKIFQQDSDRDDQYACRNNNVMV